MTTHALVPLSVISTNDDIQSKDIIYSPITAINTTYATDLNASLPCEFIVQSLSIGNMYNDELYDDSLHSDDV